MYIQIGLAGQCGKLEFADERPGIEQHCHSEPVRTTFVGISIEFQTIYRHTDCFILPFPGVHPQETVLLSRRLPHQSEDWFAMTGKSAPRHRTTERYRAAQGKNDYTNLPHDLAARPAGKFQFVKLL